MGTCSRSFTLPVVLGLALALTNPGAAHAGVIYVATWDIFGIGAPSNLYTISPPSTTATLVAPLNNPFILSQPMGLEFTLDGGLFAYSGFNLIAINPTTGVMRLIDSDSQPGTLEGGLAFDPANGLLYAAGASSDGIITINPETGARTLIDPAGPFGLDISGLAFNSDGILYGVALRDAQPDLLVTINPSTGSATPVGLTGTNASRGLAGLGFDPDDGTLYMSVDTELFVVNPTTGAATSLGVIRPPGAGPTESIGFVSGLAVQAAVPEPGTAILLGGVLFCFAGSMGLRQLTRSSLRGRPRGRIPAPGR